MLYMDIFTLALPPSPASPPLLNVSVSQTWKQWSLLKVCVTEPISLSLSFFFKRAMKSIQYTGKKHAAWSIFTFVHSHLTRIPVATYCNRAGHSLIRTQFSNSTPSKQNPERPHHNGIPHIILFYDALDSWEIQHQEVPNLHIIFILKLGLRIPTSHLGRWGGWPGKPGSKNWSFCFHASIRQF